MKPKFQKHSCEKSRGGGGSKLLNFPAKQKTLQLFLSKILAIMFLSGIFNPLLAQVGSSCANPVLLGSLNDTTLNLTISFPDTIKWYSLRTDSSRIGINFYSTMQSGFQVKQANVAMYDSICVIMQGGKYYPYPGKIGQRFEANKTVGTLVVFSISRHYDSSCGNCDSLANQVKARFQFRNAIGSVPCSNGNEPCGNLVKNGSFSHRINPVPDPNTFNTFNENLCVWTEVPAGITETEYFSSGFNDNSSASSPYSYLATHPFVDGNNYSSSFNFAPFNSLYYNANDGFVGVETGVGNSDILKTDLSSTLVAGDYYLCYFVSPGDECKNYHDKIDASISSSSYSTALPITLSSGVVTNNAVSGNASWTKLSKVFTASGGENKLYLGNIANGNYGSSSSGNSLSPLYGTYYFIDNAFLKKWDMPAMNDETVCAGEPVLIGPACSFPEVTYEWIIVGSPTVIGTSQQITVSPTSTTVYQLTISASTISGTVSLSGTVTVTVDLVNASLTANPGIVNSGGSSVLVAQPSGTGYTYQFFQVTGGVPSAISGIQTANTFNLTGLAMPSDPTTYYYQVLITSPNGCTGVYSDSVMVTDAPCEGPNVITLGVNSNWATAIIGGLVPALNSSGVTTYNGYSFLVENNFNFEYGDVIFENCTFYMDEGANFRITNTNSGDAVIFQTCAFVPCTKMWKSITIESTFAAKFYETLVTQGEFGIVVEPNNTGLRAINSSFIDNIISVTGGGISGTGRTDYYLDLTGNSFTGTGNFVAFYSGQPAWSNVRPALGVYVRNCNWADIGRWGDGSNQFTHLFNGIQLRNSIGIIENCFFDDIQRTATIPWTGSLANYYQGQGAAISSFAASELAVHSADGQSFWTNPTINNCYYGVKTLQSDFQILEVFINFDGNSTTSITESCHEGILINETPNSGTIFNSIIRARQKGIFLDENPNAGIRVDENEVFVTGRSGSSINYGIAVIEVSPGQYVKTIEGNIVHCVELSNSAYYFSSVDNAMVFHNLALDEKVSSDPDVRSFHLQTSSNNTFSCNRAEAYSVRNTSQKGFFISHLSPDNLFECNFVDKTSRGFQFEGQCLNTRLTTTSFNNHNRGLDLIALSATLPQIGVQGATNDFWGNVWNNPSTGSNNWQANNSNSSPGGYALSQFYVDPSDANNSTNFSGSWRNPYRPGVQSTWFDNDPGNSGPTAACENVNCTNTNTWEPISTEEENLRNSIQTNNMSGEFASESLYFLKEHAFKTLKTTTTDYTDDDAFEDFIDSASVTNLDRFFRVEELIQNAMVMNDASRTELNDLLDLQRALSEQIKGNHLNGVDNNGLDVQFTQTQASIDARLNAFRSQSNLNRITANWLNNSIQPENQIESNQKEMNRILIDKVHFDEVEDLSPDSTLLYSIASQCLATGGRAVIAGRNLYSRLNPDFAFDDDSICNVVVNARKAQMQHTQLLISLAKNQEKDNIILYPNPTKAAIYLEGNAVKDIVQIRVFDSRGNLVLEHYPANNPTYLLHLNVEQIPAGLYNLVSTNKNGKVSTFRFSKSE